MSEGLYDTCYCGLVIIISRQTTVGITTCSLVKYSVLAFIILKPYYDISNLRNYNVGMSMCVYVYVYVCDIAIAGKD